MLKLSPLVRRDSRYTSNLTRNKTPGATKTRLSSGEEQTMQVGTLWVCAFCRLGVERGGGGWRRRLCFIMRLSRTSLFTGLAAVLAYSCLAASGAHLSVCSLRFAVQNEGGCGGGGRADDPHPDACPPVSSPSTRIAPRSHLWVSLWLTPRGRRTNTRSFSGVCLSVCSRSPRGTTLTQSASVPRTCGSWWRRGTRDSPARRRHPTPEAANELLLYTLMKYNCIMVCK